MSLDCNIVRDLLPLCSEGMVSVETAEQVKEHLSTCPDCLRESERMKDETVHRVNDNGEETLLLKNMKKRMRRHSAAIATISALVAVTAACVVFALFFLSPGDEMGFSLLAMYLAIPLTGFVCSLVATMKKSVVGYFLPVLFGAADSLTAFAAFGYFDFFGFALGAVPSAAGFAVGLIVRIVRKKDNRQ